MTKITYLLGAGASYYSFPIWKEQAKAMQTIGNQELRASLQSHQKNIVFNYTSKEEINTLSTDKQKVLWHIAYFGKQGEKFNTVDTYARKLYLQGEYTDLNLLKMSVSIFFDLWENFYDEKFKQIYPRKKGEHQNNNVNYEKIDARYISLLSVFLEKKSSNIELNSDISFITWNYDLQLEGAFKMFIEKDKEIAFEEIDALIPFMENTNRDNRIHHLNGHRGFYETEKPDNALRKFETYENYWNINEKIYTDVSRNNAKFNNLIKYAWEQETNTTRFEKIANVLKETEILIVIGYSFPLFNRKIDQLLFNNLNSQIIKEIIYQDPHGDKDQIANLFRTPEEFKIRLLEKVEQFYIPYNHFIE